jgi:(4-O-methyl)-D-glucuronate---lignin esterase
MQVPIKFASAAARVLLSLTGLACSGLCLAAQPDADRLLSGFRNPPNAARPQVWWHWMSGNVSLEGAKLDLAWMRRVGVGGVHTFSGGGLGEPHVVDPPVDFMGDQWREAFRETTRIARESGMEVTIAGSPGWSETGGIWVAPEDAMKKYVWSETLIVGGKPYDGALAQPPATTGPFLGVKANGHRVSPAELHGDVYRDSVVIAFPTPAAELTAGTPHFDSSAGAIDLSPLRSGDLASAVNLPIAEGEVSAWIDASFDRPTTLAALTLGLGAAADVEIQASEDGSNFRRLLRASADQSESPSPQQTYAFAATSAKVFRIVLTAPPPRPLFPDLPARLSKRPERARSFALTRLTLTGGARVNRFESKAGFQPTIDSAPAAIPNAAPDAVVPSGGAINLTDHLDSAGRLRWTPPAGSWTVLRFGWSLTGQTNGPAEAKDTGLEVDKLDPAVVRGYLEHYLSLYRDAVGAELGAASVQNLLTDSWEAGVQNWTPALLAEFKARRGYDPIPYLPVLAGRVVSNASTSDRFLWDFRRTLKDLLADNHYGVLRQVLQEHGMGYYTEAQGDNPRAIGDGMTMKSRADIPTAEFWYRPFATAVGQPSLKADLKEAASAAHVYGRPLAAAESLTVAAGSDPWAFSPAMLKPVADEIFAQGINRILLHESHHQPLLNQEPGLTMGFFGQFFNRNETWAEEAGAWVSYLSRTSFLLQQGTFVADVAYFYGEDRNLTELYNDRFNGDVPEGYGYDYINPEALMTLLSVSDGSLATPSGMRYRVLYIPAYVTRLTLPAIRKLRDLVASGAVLVGPKTLGGLGIESPDAEVVAIADQLWGTDAGAPEARSFGKGRVYPSADLSAALKREMVVPDVSVSGAAGALLSVHRHDGDADIYFLSNRQSEAQNLQVAFRVKDKAPDLWHAEDGRVEQISYRLTDEGIRVPLRLEANEAVFVVLRRPAVHAHWNAPDVISRPLATVEGSWRVRFQPGRGAPTGAKFDRLFDWSTASDPGVKYFSGRATYSKTVHIPKSWIKPRRRLVLDLGSVRELAVVSVDGKAVATSWHPPYQVDLTAVFKAGDHRLDVAVVNSWVNRLVGDRQAGANAVAFAPQSPYRADSPLPPSGLLGPVSILAHDSR